MNLCERALKGVFFASQIKLDAAIEIIIHYKDVKNKTFVNNHLLQGDFYCASSKGEKWGMQNAQSRAFIYHFSVIGCHSYIAHVKYLLCRIIILVKINHCVLSLAGVKGIMTRTPTYLPYLQVYIMLTQLLQR